MSPDKYIMMGNHRLKLSNLTKTMYPQRDIVKAEVIQYYVLIAPHLLHHIKYRPLTFVRFPDGVDGEFFFQKNKPAYAPEWIETVRMGSEKKIRYIVATRDASIVWLANQACIEFHQVSSRHPSLDTPDHFVLDLDPPTDMHFDQIKEIAFLLREELLKLNYVPFVKTSGKKGLHLYCPIQPRWQYDEIRKSLRRISEAFVHRHSGITTTNIRKDKRRDKLFIDIVRNGRSQTVVCPYSLRSTPEATVSMPVTWEELASVSSPKEFNINTVRGILEDRGDAWEDFNAHASPLHDHVNPQRTSEVPASLKAYVERRNFLLSTEPQPGTTEYADDRFVLHRHSATRLHYDLRISEDGVLKSWAVPKGLPASPGMKHLAIQTEDHPAEYYDFEGEIPKGEYGAGRIWIAAQGNFNITKTKRNGFYFWLHSKVIDAEFRMHKMKEKEWLLERVSQVKRDFSKFNIKPMLCSVSSEVPTAMDFVYEVKWDGIRTLLVVGEQSIRLQSRSGRNISLQFPELTSARKYLNCTNAIIDGEIVVTDEEGRPDFKRTISRLHRGGEAAIEQGSRQAPAYLYLFDVLFIDGIWIEKLPLSKRRAWLHDLIKAGGPFRFSEGVSEGVELFDATLRMGLEGIVAKNLNSPYLQGERSDHWVKVKHRKTVTCQIIGYTEGKGDRKETFGALHILDIQAKMPIYLGKVGTGFDERTLDEITRLLKERSPGTKPISEKVEDERLTTWIDEELFCEVSYTMRTERGTLREPVFLRLRDDV